MDNWIKHLHLSKPKRIISIATDCSGIEAPIHTLQRLGIRHNHLFSSEVDPKCKKLINSVFKPKLYFDDIFSRDLRKVNKQLDIYICGFPCQSFSIAGKKLGFEDTRGIVFFECLKTISSLTPRVFILENVKNLTCHDSGKTLKIILNKLKSLKIYNIYWKVLNTKDFCIPQNRPRVYFIGILKTCDNGFKFPNPIICPDIKIDAFLEKKNLPESVLTKSQSVVLQQRMQNKNKRQHYIINLGVSTTGGFGSAMKDTSPCLLSSHKYYYSTKKKRFMTVPEWASLQGFDPSILDPTLLSYKQLGNTMSVNVLAFVFQNIFNSVKF
jgi:DNA (cytosine-5)-methyltransferase 1